MEEQQDIEKLYNNAYNQYCQTKLEIRQIKDKLKKETNTNTAKKLQQILFLKKRILYPQRRRYENILFKKHQSYKRQQAILKFKNIIQFRLKRVCEWCRIYSLCGQMNDTMFFNKEQQGDDDVSRKKK